MRFQAGDLEWAPPVKTNDLKLLKQTALPSAIDSAVGTTSNPNVYRIGLAES